MICRTCKGEYYHEKFKNCEACRFVWRQQQRKPDGYINTIDDLKKQNAELKRILRRLGKEVQQCK